MDEGIELSRDAISIMSARMIETGALAAAPAMRMRFSDTSWPVRAYYRVWQELPYVKEGMIGVGIYFVASRDSQKLMAKSRVLATERPRAEIVGAT